MSNTERTLLAPSEFVADLDAHPGLAVESEWAYWLGVTVACPVNQIDCGPFNFPKMQEVIMPNLTTGVAARVPVIGGLVLRVNKHQLDVLRTKLTQLVIRFTDQPAQLETSDGSGKNMKDPIQRARKGFVIKIPTIKDMKDAAKTGAPRRPYVRQPSDRPAAEFMYMKLCEDQTNPERGLHAPLTLADAGVLWPGDKEELDRLLS